MFYQQLNQCLTKYTYDLNEIYHTQNATFVLCHNDISHVTLHAKGF